MTPEQITKAVAELANITVDKIEGRKSYECVPQRGSPDDEYRLVLDLDSRDAIIGVIEKHSEIQARVAHFLHWEFWDNEIELETTERSEMQAYIRFGFLATPAQLCEALLRATNKWID